MMHRYIPFQFNAVGNPVSCLKDNPPDMQGLIFVILQIPLPFLPLRLSIQLYSIAKKKKKKLITPPVGS